MNKNIGLVLLVAILGFVAVSYMKYMQEQRTVVDNDIILPAVMPEKAPIADVMEKTDIESEEDAKKVEEKLAPSDSIDIADIEADADISDIENDLKDIEGIDLNIDQL